MKKPNANLRLVFAFVLLAAAGSSLAELADRDKPVNLVADNVTVDDAKQISITANAATASGWSSQLFKLWYSPTLNPRCRQAATSSPTRS